MNENEQAIFDIIMKHMRINGSEDCSTSEFESDVEDASKEIAAQQSVQADGAYWACEKCNSIVSVKFDVCGLCNSPRR